MRALPAVVIVVGAIVSSATRAQVPAAPSSPPATPRLVAPISGARVTSQRPSLRWAGGDAVHVDLCRDRACARIVETIDTRESHAAPKAALPAGAIFWRVRAAASTSATWQLWVGHRSAPLDTVSGQWLDVDGDGFTDAAVGRELWLGGKSGPHAQTGGPFADVQRLVLAGDLDGDGYTDAVGVSDGPQAQSQPLRVYLGGPSGLSRTATTTIAAPKKTRTFASALAAAGDVNGDGYADLLVGAPGVLEAYVFFGAPGGLAKDPPLTLTKPSRHEHSSFGVTVDAAGDVDGDGFADFIVTASGNNYLYVFRGGAPRPSAEPLLAMFGGGDTQYASAMRGAGDVDGDGYADLVHSFLPDPGGEPTYDARLLRGGPKLVPARATLLPLDPPATDEGRGYLSVGGAGDLDGDGYDDLFILDERADELLIIPGAPSGAKKPPRHLEAKRKILGVEAVGDINGDGFADLLLRHDRATTTFFGSATRSSSIP